MTIDTNSYEPAYIQLAGIIRAWIDKGDLPPGAAVPSEASLSQRFGIARETARRAVALLRAEGLIVTTRAVGSFVRLPGQREPVTAGAGTTIQARMPTTGERRSLGIPEGVPVLVIMRPNGEQELAPADRVTIVVAPEPAVSPMPIGAPAPVAPAGPSAATPAAVTAED
ncbi:MAG TPA: GntR family transcriptional regulator [Streptosporangiaceae bacterium]